MSWDDFLNPLRRQAQQVIGRNALSLARAPGLEVSQARAARDSEPPGEGRRGTRVTVCANDIGELRYIPGLRDKQHMYVQFDDGRDQLIARGEPSEHGPRYLGSALNDSLTVKAGVSPSRLSRDAARCDRFIEQDFLPGISAQQASAAARAHASEVNRTDRRYGLRANSNSYAADVIEQLFGHRPGDARTPGYLQRLDSAPRVHPFDLSPAMRPY